MTSEPGPEQMPRYLAVLDFEATCDQRGADSDFDPALQEIIEWPVGLIDTEYGEVIDTFRRLVRPVAQPVLSAFCTELTSLQQHEFEGQPTIAEALADFESWAAGYGLSPDNCVAVTCGDWDLLHMWPRQVSLVGGLHTPALFRHWVNIKVVFKSCHGRKAPGMMGMLRMAGIEHVGHHHLGIDDVRNLCNLALWLLDGGARFELTFTEEHRRAEHRRRHKKLLRRERALADKRAALERLPAETARDVRERMLNSVERMEEELARARRATAVFAPEALTDS